MDIGVILKIALIGVLTAIVNQILRKFEKDEIATVTTIAGLVIALIMVVDMISQLFSTLKTLFAFY